MKLTWRPITRVVLCLVLAGMAGRPQLGSAITGAVDRRPLVDPRPLPVSLTLQTTKSQYARGEPIFLECELANNSKTLECHYRFLIIDEPVPVRDLMFLHVAVAGPRGPTPLTHHGRAGNGGGFKSEVIPPGGTYRSHYYLNTFFDMTRDGEYTITAMFPVWFQGPKAPTGMVSIQALPIRVKVQGAYPNPWRIPPLNASPENPE